MLILIIGYISDDDAEVKWGVIYVSIFTFLMFMSAYFSNRFIFEGYNTSANLRKTITVALYNKVQRLTIKSLTETDSGKVISIISGDLQAIARPLCFTSIILAAPFVNLTAYIVLAITSGVEYALITFAWWILLIILQHYASQMTKRMRGMESSYNDERQRLVTDMIVGARTIKAYGWENHYMDKIRNARKN
jgi:ABC-type multidrug transport system fused ATPase/permease subunit